MAQTPFSSPELLSTIIPAYNEGKHLGRVLNVVTQLPEISQIIVVDDGSTDDTAALVQSWQVLDNRILLHRLNQNGGKGQALLAGVSVARHDLMLFLDADLLGLRPQHLHDLISPVRDGEYAMTVARFWRGRVPTDLAHLFLPYLSGQRCLRWSHFQNLFGGADSGWSIEIALNLHAWRHRYPVRRVPWLGASHAMRPEKRPGLAGFHSHALMWWDITRYLWKFVAQFGLRPGEVTRWQGDKVTG